MSDQTDNLSNLIEPFGLNPEEARIYLDMLEKGTSTALRLSRDLHVGRTKVYRLLDKLIDKELVIQKFDSAGLKFVASDPSQLELLLSHKEGELSALRNSLPDTLATLHSKMGLLKPESKILYYHGQRGLSQVNWNLLRAKKEFLSYEIATADAYMPQKEAEELRQELVDHRILARTITNKKVIEPFTRVSELITKWWQIRHIAPKILAIKADVFIYNNVFAECHYLNSGDVFCFEMYNEQMAQMQKSLFENLWKQAEVMKIENSQGKASV
jgi:sugar-specific transcriptional regulator TrmB